MNLMNITHLTNVICFKLYKRVRYGLVSICFNIFLTA